MTSTKCSKKGYFCKSSKLVCPSDCTKCHCSSVSLVYGATNTLYLHNRPIIIPSKSRICTNDGGWPLVSSKAHDQWTYSSAKYGQAPASTQVVIEPVAVSKKDGDLVRSGDQIFVRRNGQRLYFGANLVNKEFYDQHHRISIMRLSPTKYPLTIYSIGKDGEKITDPVPILEGESVYIGNSSGVLARQHCPFNSITSPKTARNIILFNDNNKVFAPQDRFFEWSFYNKFGSTDFKNAQVKCADKNGCQGGFRCTDGVCVKKKPPYAIYLAVGAVIIIALIVWFVIHLIRKKKIARQTPTVYDKILDL